MSRRVLVLFVLFVTAFVAIGASQGLGGISASRVGPAGGPGQAFPPTNTRQVPVGTGVLSGIVVAADTGQPIRDAQVTLNGQAEPPSGTGAAVTTNAASHPTPPGGGQDVSRSAMTDDAGAFSFDHLPPGQFRVSANDQDFISTSYGQSKPNRPGTWIPLAGGQHAVVTLRLIRGGVIAGTVIGETGAPEARAQVSVLRYAIEQGVRRLQPAGGAQSDDRGAYRFAGLQPGEYLVGAAPNSMALQQSERDETERAALEQAIKGAGPAVEASPYAIVTVTTPMNMSSGAMYDGRMFNGRYLPTYFPSATSPATATSITLGPGEERSGVDVRTLMIRGTDITGTITNMPADVRTSTTMPGGRIATSVLRVMVSAMSDDHSADQSQPQTVDVGPDGTFHLRNLGPGQYTVFAQRNTEQMSMIIAQRAMIMAPGSITVDSPAPPPADPVRLWGRATVTVDGQTTPALAIALQPGRSISGQVIFAMAHPPDLTRARVTVNAVQGGDSTMPVMGQMEAQVGADGRFTLEGVIPGEYTLRVNMGGGGGFLKSSIVNGIDTLDFPFVFDAETDVTGAVITMTDRSSGLSGTLTDASGKGVTSDTIVLASEDPRYWTPGTRRVRVAEPDANGHYTFSSLPAGQYWVAAVTDLDRDGEYDPEFLKTLAPGSIRVTLGEGDAPQQNIRLAP